MATSLEKGIKAAKAGRMDQALYHLKDAIIEEPQNADVWVWIAAIIDDIDKQEIFLEKALDIDPQNIPAQRGLAYLQKRKSEQVNNVNDHLSDHTRPISPFPASESGKGEAAFSGWTNVSPSEILDSQDNQNNENGKKGKSQKDPNKLTPFEIFLLSVVVIVFSIIGLLASSAIFNFELPLAFLTTPRPQLKTEPPYAGVFLYENDTFYNIEQYEGLPTSEEAMPISSQKRPLITLWQVIIDPEKMDLIYQNGDFIPFDVFTNKGNAHIIQPIPELSDGLYCLNYNTPSQEIKTYFWCFNIEQNEKVDTPEE